MKHYLTVNEAATFIGCGRTSIYYLIKTKKISAVRVLVIVKEGCKPRPRWKILSSSVREYRTNHDITPIKIAETSGYHPETLRRLAREHQIKADKKGARWAIDRRSVRKHK
jgi:predicted urease superfamily metal-dependent hydrolase